MNGAPDLVKNRLYIKNKNQGSVDWGSFEDDELSKCPKGWQCEGGAQDHVGDVCQCDSDSEYDMRSLTWKLPTMMFWGVMLLSLLRYFLPARPLFRMGNHIGEWAIGSKIGEGAGSEVWGLLLCIFAVLLALSKI